MARKSAAARRRGLTGLSLTALQTELRRRERRVGALMRRRERVAAKLQRLDSEIESMGGRAGRIAGVRTRPKNDMNLVESLQKLLTGKTMSVTDATQAVQDAGYKTSAENFRTIVNQTLINSGKFKRVSRGQYTTK
ncbi:MAG: hypothetical protein KF745_09380 [Phycisphaeraceae bacterium]|nr:hypothetical protein [Phycisphaeraceae bacterium]